MSSHGHRNCDHLGDLSHSFCIVTAQFRQYSASLTSVGSLSFHCCSFPDTFAALISTTDRVKQNGGHASKDIMKIIKEWNNIKRY